MYNVDISEKYDIIALGFFLLQVSSGITRLSHARVISLGTYVMYINLESRLNIIN